RTKIQYKWSKHPKSSPIPLTLRQLSLAVITIFLYIRTRLWSQGTFPNGNHHSKGLAPP
ncbi:hypothetical protein A2U01_0029278, partial [Trifolium medium]|nr:hypothetical protein [Trifolium medium]